MRATEILFESRAAVLKAEAEAKLLDKQIELEKLRLDAKAIRAEVLEEAAEWFLYEDNKHLFHSEMLWPHQVAERLRQLKDKP